MEKEVNQTPNLANNPNKSKQTASKKREEKKILRPMFKPYNLGTNPNEFGRITPKRRAEKRKKKKPKNTEKRKVEKKKNVVTDHGKQLKAMRFFLNPPS